MLSSEIYATFRNAIKLYKTKLYLVLAATVDITHFSKIFFNNNFLIIFIIIITFICFIMKTIMVKMRKNTHFMTVSGDLLLF